MCRLLDGGRYSAGAAALLLPPLLRAVSLLPGLTSLLEPLLALLAAGPSGAAARLQEAAYWPVVADVSPDLCRAALLADTLAGEEKVSVLRFLGKWYLVFCLAVVCSVYYEVVDGYSAFTTLHHSYLFNPRLTGVSAERH